MAQREGTTGHPAEQATPCADNRQQRAQEAIHGVVGVLGCLAHRHNRLPNVDEEIPQQTVIRETRGRGAVACGDSLLGHRLERQDHLHTSRQTLHGCVDGQTGMPATQCAECSVPYHQHPPPYHQHVSQFGGGGGAVGMTPGCVAVCSWRPIGLSPLTLALPFLEPFPSIGSSAHRPLTTLRPPSPRLAYPYLPTHPSFPSVGCANGTPGLSLFHCSVLGPHRGGQLPSPLARYVPVDTPYRRWGTPPQRRPLGSRMSTCGVTSPTGAHNNLPRFGWGGVGFIWATVSVDSSPSSPRTQHTAMQAAGTVIGMRRVPQLQPLCPTPAPHQSGALRFGGGGVMIVRCTRPSAPLARSRRTFSACVKDCPHLCASGNGRGTLDQEINGRGREIRARNRRMRPCDIRCCSMHRAFSFGGGSPMIHACQKHMALFQILQMAKVATGLHNEKNQKKST